jgi:molybdate transport system substrate-binding protein
MKIIFSFFLLFLASNPLWAKTEITIVAASSLTDTLTKLLKIYEQKHSIKISLSFDSSARLARQIKEGAHADLFFSADKEWTLLLEKENFILPQHSTDFLSNKLVVIAHRSSSLKLNNFSAVGDLPLKTLCMGFGTSPVGKYGYEALNKAQVFSKVSSKIVHGENARHVLEWVAKNEADAGIVFLTDARSEPRVKVLVEIPKDLHSQVIYPVSLVGKNPSPASLKLSQFLKSEEAKKVFEEGGFTVFHP